jgi:hypothetical protein
MVDLIAYRIVFYGRILVICVYNVVLDTRILRVGA